MTANSTPEGWQPILDGALASRATDALRAIARDVANVPEPSSDVAVFWAYVANVFEGEFEDAHAAAMQGLEREIVREPYSVGLFSGVAGTAWAVAHCAEDADAYLELVDQQIVDALNSDGPWRGHYDLISGLVGLGVYFLERGEAPLAVSGLEAVIERLAQWSERHGEQITWHTPIALVPAHEHARYPTGWYNCGLAHGVPGVVSIAARIAERNVARARAAELRDGGVAWLYAQRTIDPARSRFPTTASPAQDGSARTAWCYGDPGVILSLWDAASRSGAPTDELRELAVTVLSRSPELAAVRDAPLCHGASGLAHIANRMFHATGDARFRDLARGWYEHALAMQRPSGGIGGFYAYHPPMDGTDRDPWVSEPELLDGVVGIGLALAAAITAMEPEWDRKMLCDVRAP